LRLPLPQKQVIGGRLHEAVKIGRLDRNDLRHEFAYCVTETKEATTDGRCAAAARVCGRQDPDIRNVFLIECQIYDRSDTGARLRLVGDISLPSRIRLYEDASERLFDAAIAWRKGRVIGICHTVDNQARPSPGRSWLT